MSFLINLLRGIVIGTGFIIPGVSGGALAVIMGIYDNIFYSIKNLKNKDNFIFLLTVSIGIVIGIIGFGNILLLLLDYREVPTKYVFIGFILGGIPSLIKNVKEKNKDKFKLTPFLIAIIISIILYVLETTNNGINISHELVAGNIPFIGLFFACVLGLSYNLYFCCSGVVSI